MQTITVEEVARRLQVHEETVRRWLRDGKLKGVRLGRRAGWRVEESEYRRFLADESEHDGTRREG